MNGIDAIVESDDAPIETMVVTSIESSPTRYLGYIGWNLFKARKTADFTDPIVVGDVVSLTESELGVYEITGKVGTDSFAFGDQVFFTIPWDYQQVGWTSDEEVTLFSGVLALPPAYLIHDDVNAREVVYGHVNGELATTTAFWGFSAYWAYGTSFGNSTAQKLTLLPLEPDPKPVTLTLLSARRPGDVSAPVGDPLPVTLSYRGPDVPTVVDLPEVWQTAFADGSAGAIRFDPTGAGEALTRLAVGPHRSLSLHR